MYCLSWMTYFGYMDSSMMLIVSLTMHSSLVIRRIPNLVSRVCISGRVPYRETAQPSSTSFLCERWAPEGRSWLPGVEGYWQRLPSCIIITDSLSSMKQAQLKISIQIHTIKLKVRFPCSITASLRVCTLSSIQNTKKCPIVRNVLWESVRLSFRWELLISSLSFMTHSATSLKKRK